MTRIIDSHCHIYPEKIAQKAVDAVEEFYGGLPRKPWGGTASELLRVGAEAGISHYVVFSVATSPRQVSSINRFIAQSVSESGGTMTGLGTMHPDSDDFARDLSEIEALGLKGVKLHPDIQHFEADDPRAFEIYRLCEERGLPVCIHAGDSRYDYSNPERLSRILESFPRLRMIAAHLGGWSVWENATERLARYPNLMVDTSSSIYWLGVDTTRRLIRMYGSERVLFGTDYPLWPQRPEIDDLLAMGLENEEYENIFWRNAVKLYGLCPDRDETEETKHA
ncbi:MAG: amidohydrolase [Clostridia bacterium]|nr:amidohydrolase [Clostridia bacterium]